MADYQEDASGNAYSPDHYVSPQPKKTAYRPRLLNMQTYMLTLENVYGYLTDAIWQAQNYAATKIASHRWRQMEPHEPQMIMQRVLEYIFEKKVEGREYDGQFYDMLHELAPTFNQLGINDTNAAGIVNETCNLLVGTIGAIFPQMSFGQTKNVSFNISNNTALYVVITDDVQAQDRQEALQSHRSQNE